MFSKLIKLFFSNPDLRFCILPLFHPHRYLSHLVHKTRIPSFAWHDLIGFIYYVKDSILLWSIYDEPHYSSWSFISLNASMGVPSTLSGFPAMGFQSKWLKLLFIGVCEGKYADACFSDIYQCVLIWQMKAWVWIC